MRLGADNPAYAAVGGDGPQTCAGELIRFRTLTGICNNLFNPAMGSTGTLFARNAQFEAIFPDLGKNALAVARHSDTENGSRIGLYKPDPQLISRTLFTRAQSSPTCNQGLGLPDYSAAAQCDYQKAPFFNVLAAFWIQFMTHDWFSHTNEGRNQPGLVSVGCESEAAIVAGCRPGDRMEASLYADTTDPATFEHEGEQYLSRAFRTTQNHVSAWWDASQIYGHDEISQTRVLRDSGDAAKLRDIYGTHVCDASKVITAVQRDTNGDLLNDCLGHPDGSRVDNIEDVDMVVGWLAEYTRPHGYAISETQFHIFIINASRRLFSDRFFTSSFRPEFYSRAGYDWVLNNSPFDDCPYPLTEARDGSMDCLEPEPVNGYTVAVSPMKRVMMRNIPELRDELLQVVNVFVPWARDRGE